MSGVTKKGIDAQRRLHSGRTNNDDELKDLVSDTPARCMFKAVVVDVIFDPTAQELELRQTYSRGLLNAELLLTAPRNSIIARVISDAADRRDKTPSVFYPFFSHTHQPVKPGEKVWVMFETPGSRDLGYWLSRVVERIDIDDPNFTHGDRTFIVASKPDSIDKFNASQTGTSVETRPSFPNGTGTEDGFTLSGENDYENINSGSIANRVIKKEPVPRYTKRPGDWVAEGSNNSIIILGDDRAGMAAAVHQTQSGNDSITKVKGKPLSDALSNGGMFDIVVGRGTKGRNPTTNEISRIRTSGDIPILTAPPVITNARDELETDKSLTNVNPVEGDPDFENDATRIYGAMSTDVDNNFGKKLPKITASREAIAVGRAPAAIVKSDNIRIIVRDKGTIRIVKEGILDDEGGKGHAVIMIEPDGTIMIDGPKIVIGSGIEKNNGGGTQVTIGRDATEPMVLGVKNRDTLKQYTDDMKTALDGLQDALNALAAGAFGGPSPVLVSAAVPTFAGAVNKFKSDINNATKTFQDTQQSTLSKIAKTK